MVEIFDRIVFGRFFFAVLVVEFVFGNCYIVQCINLRDLLVTFCEICPKEQDVSIPVLWYQVETNTHTFGK